MSKRTNTILTAAFAAAMIAAPAASFAQTSNEATSTGGREHIKDQNDSDKTRMNQTTAPSGSSSSSGYTESNPAPKPNAQENEPRPNK